MNSQCAKAGCHSGEKQRKRERVTGAYTACSEEVGSHGRGATVGTEAAEILTGWQGSDSLDVGFGRGEAIYPTVGNILWVIIEQLL